MLASGLHAWAPVIYMPLHCQCVSIINYPKNTKLNWNVFGVVDTYLNIDKVKACKSNGNMWNLYIKPLICAFLKFIELVCVISTLSWLHGSTQRFWQYLLFNQWTHWFVWPSLGFFVEQKIHLAHEPLGPTCLYFAMVYAGNWQLSNTYSQSNTVLVDVDLLGSGKKNTNNIAVLKGYGAYQSSCYKQLQ